MQQITSSRRPYVIWIGLAILALLLLAAGAVYYSLESARGVEERSKRMMDQERSRHQQPPGRPRDSEGPPDTDSVRRDRPRVDPE